jgi:nitrite reductase/ring-hydroxylating ferredoxin subunit
MTIAVNNFGIRSAFINAIYFIVLLGCSSGPSDDPIPRTVFSTISVNVTLPEYQKLQTNNWIYINGGVRGIILYKESNSSYIAYERNCSYHPNDACATVNVHSSNLYMVDACCNSTFEFATGNPTNPPAWRPLNKYATTLSGSTLTITDEVLN